MTPEFEKILEPLREYAKRLDRMDTPSPVATPFYELMSGGLVWSDEKITDVPSEVIWALRPLFAYRASLIVGAPEEKWRPYWNECRTLFPRWVGFHPDRQRQAPELIVLLKKGEAAMLRDLEAGLEEPIQPAQPTRGKAPRG